MTNISTRHEDSLKAEPANECDRKSLTWLERASSGLFKITRLQTTKLATASVYFNPQLEYNKAPECKETTVQGFIRYINPNSVWHPYLVCPPSCFKLEGCRDECWE